MNIFIIGLPNSGRTTAAKALVESGSYLYIDAVSWIRKTFRPINSSEHELEYEDEYHNYVNQMLSINPRVVSENIRLMMHIGDIDNKVERIFVIDGILSPQDFINLFDYRKDIVVFLNRIDNESDSKDHENIGMSVIRDYCFWMSSAGLIKKNHWLEYNFRINDDNSDFVKAMGARNSVFIVKSIKRVISHLTEKVKELTDI